MFYCPIVLTRNSRFICFIIPIHLVRAHTDRVLFTGNRDFVFQVFEIYKNRQKNYLKIDHRVFVGFFF